MVESFQIGERRIAGKPLITLFLGKEGVPVQPQRELFRGDQILEVAGRVAVMP
jgi:hypothetical protein